MLTVLYRSTVYAATLANPPPALVLNEVHADPADDLTGDANRDGRRSAQEDEFIELVNRGEQAIDLGGWAVQVNETVQHTFPSGTTVDGGRAVVVFGGGQPSGDFGGAVIQVASAGRLDLPNYAATLTLTKPDGTSVSTAYDASAARDQSLTRSPDLGDSWLAHLDASGGAARYSPGVTVDGRPFLPPEPNTPPAVIAVSPPNTAVGVPLMTELSVTFSEPVSTMPSWIDLECDSSGNHSLAVAFTTAESYTLTAATPFTVGETCHVTVHADRVADLDQPPLTLAADYHWSFSTQLPADAAPQLAATVPLTGALGWPLTATLSLTFTEPVEISPAAFELTCAPGASLPLVVSGGPLAYDLTPDQTLPRGRSCTLTVHAAQVRDLDTSDPPDHPAADEQVRFTAAAADFLLINEIDAANLGPDLAEFIELFDGGRGHTPLDGLTLVLYNGESNRVYFAHDLAGYQSDAEGYFLAGSPDFPGAVMDLELDEEFVQNGGAAVALYAAPAARFPLGAALTTENLVDAVVYSANGQDPVSLLPLLLPGEAAVNENEAGLADYQSSQRCPNASGGPRRSITFGAALPTPGTANTCLRDDAPQVIRTTPAASATQVAPDQVISVEFSEEVSVYGRWATIDCSRSGLRAVVGSATGLNLILNNGSIFSTGEECLVTLDPLQISDVDYADPPDHPSPIAWSFAIRPASHVLINEVDSATLGPDTAEFIELYDGGAGHTALDGLVVVLFNGSDDASYRTIDLAGMETDEGGYFVVGNPAVTGADLTIPVSSLQNGPDAVALYAASDREFPTGTDVTTAGLLDALVYATDGNGDEGLQALLQAGQRQVNEGGRGAKDQHSNQRCPDGSGGQRNTASYLQNKPTPGYGNHCVIDEAPQVVAVEPLAGSTAVPTAATLQVEFSEPVIPGPDAFSLRCDKSGSHSLEQLGGPRQFTLAPGERFEQGESCTVQVKAIKVQDADEEDPPDRMEADYVWSFSTAVRPVATNLLINEVDAATTGLDTAEFIELYDGGAGQTALDGLLLVLFNGSDDASYRTIDLAGMETDEGGYFVVGNPAVTGADLTIPVSSLQNGPDAVALYAASDREFPTGTAVTTAGLLDALVYNSNGEGDSGLQQLLLSGQVQVNEDGGGAMDMHSNQRCPNGSGGHRRTDSIRQNYPTPGAGNNCLIDEGPTVVAVSPITGSTAVPTDAILELRFSEPVALAVDAVSLHCDKSGHHSLQQIGGPTEFRLTHTRPFEPGESCVAQVAGDKVRDTDTADPPDNMVADYSWAFATVVRPVATNLLINEVDADTPGADRAEFVELYDGGRGRTPLDGLVLAFYNGSDSTIYRTIDLAGLETDPNGYFVAGGPETPRAGFGLPSGAIQNGPDAVALYAGPANGLRPGTDVVLEGLLDALVYHSNDDPQPGLELLLLPGNTAVNEAALRDAEYDSNQRCPNGHGSRRASSAFIQNQPSPGEPNNCILDLPPSVHSYAPASGATEVSPATAIAVAFSESIAAKEGWLAISCAGQEVPMMITGGPRQYAGVPADGLLPAQAPCTAVIKAGHVRDQDGYADPLPGDVTWQFTTGPLPFGSCGAPATFIHDLDARLLDDPAFVEEQVTVEAVVTGAFQGAGALGGFFLQEESPQVDKDPATSEALFVPDGEQVPTVTTGQIIRLQGRAAARDGLVHLTPVVRADICPGESTIEPYRVSVPIDGQTLHARRLGMLVTTSEALAVIGSDELGSDGRLLLAPAWQPYPTSILPPGPEATSLAQTQQDERLILDDGSLVPYPSPLLTYLGPQGTVRAGDMVGEITGILSLTLSGAYAIQPTQPVSITNSNLRSEPAPLVEGRLRVALVDGGGYFNGDGRGDFSGSRGAASAAEFERQRAKLITAILALGADIIPVTGLENDGGHEGSAVADLLAGLNATAAGTTRYAAVSIAEAQAAPTTVPALLYRADRVTPRAAAMPLPGSERTAGAALLAQEFVAVTTGHGLAIVVAEFVARDDCPPVGDANADGGDGQGCWNRRRMEQAAALAQWLQEAYPAEGESEVLVLGELHAYNLEEPLQALGATGYTNIGGLYLDGDAYDRLDDGRGGRTRHAFASPTTAAQLAAVELWDHNAAEPAVLDYRLSNQAGLYLPDPFRAASHDTLVVDLGRAMPQAIFANNSPQPIGHVVRFSNHSTGPQPLRFEWDFGDGSPRSTAVDMTHRYTAVGTYTVTLHATTVWGATSEATTAVRIDPAQLLLPFQATAALSGFP